MNYIANAIKRAQRAFQEKVLNRVVAALAEKNMGLLHRCVFDLPNGLVSFIGGHEDAVADLGLSYMKAIKDWVCDGKPGRVGTYIGNGVRWGACALARENHVIIVPTPYQIGCLQTRSIKAKALECRRVRLLHGSESRREDAAFLVTDKDRLHQRELKAMLDAAMKTIRPGRALVARCRMNGMSLIQTAKHIKRSRERVRQIEMRAMEDIKKALCRLYHNAYEML